MERAIAIEGKIFVCPRRAAPLVGVTHPTLAACARRGSSWFGMPLETAKLGEHVLLEERQCFVLAAVNREFPVSKGPIPRARREQMRQYAERVRAKLMPAP
jgi:hypothetical protein